MTRIVFDISTGGLLFISGMSALLGIITIIASFGVSLPVWALTCVFISGFITLMPFMFLLFGIFTYRVEQMIDDV